MQIQKIVVEMDAGEMLALRQLLDDHYRMQNELKLGYVLGENTPLERVENFIKHWCPTMKVERNG